MRLRRQGDGLGDEASKNTSKDFSQPVIVRPEFGPETDIKTILRRHGLGVTLDATKVQRGPPEYTETNYDIDLTRALSQLKRAHAAFEALPQKHKDKFQTADELWNHYRDGNLQEENLDKQPPTGDITPTPQRE